MKRKAYTLLLGVFTVLFFINNVTGPIVKQQKGYTGAPGDQAGTCATCHNTGTFAPTAKIEVFDSLGTTLVTRYVLGRQYTIRMTITAASGTPTGFGFQMIDIRKKDSSNVKGFLAKTSQAANIGIDTITTSGRIYAEHNARLTSNIIDVKWKAPSTDLGTIVFYGAGNAVNAGGTNAGDNGTPSTSVQIVSPLSAKTNELAENVHIQLSPNPTPSVLTINLESKVSRALDLRVADMSGRAVISEKWAIQTGENQKIIDLKSLVKGAYMIQILDNQNVISKKIVKL
jgi:Secretion system C-terminal sorting domain